MLSLTPKDRAEQLARHVVAHLAELDASLEKLSHLAEGRLARLPAWTLTSRRVTVGVNRHGTLAAVRVLPDPERDGDSVEALEVITDDDLERVTAPYAPHGFTVDDFRAGGYMEFGGVTIHRGDDPHSPALVDEDGIWGLGHPESALARFSTDAARAHAIDMWNASMLHLASTSSAVDQIAAVFDMLQRIIKRKAFLERRVHRFIHQHAAILLPPHQRCWFELPLRLGDEVRRADFVLERELGMPPLLVELETPAASVFRRNGEPTAEANHACKQIAEWVKFIDHDAPTNAAGELSFLTGPKQRLVIMGRGTASERQVLDSRFSDTVIWTYDVLLLEARRRWQRAINEQRQLLDLPTIPLFEPRPTLYGDPPHGPPGGAAAQR